VAGHVADVAHVAGLGRWRPEGLEQLVEALVALALVAFPRRPLVLLVERRVAAGRGHKAVVERRPPTKRRGGHIRVASDGQVDEWRVGAKAMGAKEIRLDTRRTKVRRLTIGLEVKA